METSKDSIQIKVTSTEDSKAIDTMLDKLKSLKAIASRGSDEAKPKSPLTDTENETKQSVNRISKLIEALKKKYRELGSIGTGRVRTPQTPEQAKNQAEIDVAPKQGGFGTKMVNASKSAFNGLGFVVKKLGSTIAWASQGLTGFAAGLLRVAKYRFFRMVLNGLAKGLREGINNLYAFSSAVNGAFAQSMNGLASNARYASNALGSMVAPIINAVAPAINYIANLFVRATNAIAQFFAALGGATSWAKPKKQAISFGGAAGKALGGASKGAKKLKKDLQLLNFDQMNILKDNKASSGGSGGGGGGGGGIGAIDGFENAKVNSKIAKLAKDFKKAWKDGDMTKIGKSIGEAINNGLDDIEWKKITSSLKLIGKRFGTLISGIFKGVDWGLLTRSIGEGIISVLKGLYSFVRNIDFYAVGKAIVDGIVGFPYLRVLVGAGDLVIKGIGVGLGGLIVGGVTSAVKHAANGITKMATYGTSLVDGFFNGIGNRLKSIASWVKTNIFTPVINAVKSAFGIASPAKTMKPLGGYVIEGFFEGMKSAWKTVASWLGGLAGKVAAFFGKKKTTKQEVVVNLKKGNFKSLSAWLGAKKAQVSITLKKSGWSNIKTWIGISKPLSASVKLTKISNVKKALGLDKTITLKVAIPKLKGTVSINTNTKQSAVSWSGNGYSYFANGGFPKQGQMFVAREAGAEMVGSLNGRTAVANNDQIEQGIASAVYPAVFNAIMNAMSNGAFESSVVLQGDARKIFQLVRDENKKNTISTGKNALAY